MLHHFFKTAVRNFLKNKTSSFINVIGLSVGFTCVLFILFHVKEELAYDKGFHLSKRIFRITQENIGSNNRRWAATAPVMSSSLKDFFPEIEKSVRFQRPYPYQLLSFQSSASQVNKFEEKNGLFADPDVTTVFDIPFLEGDKNTALTKINSIVITDKMARRYFGNQPALGKTINDDVYKIPFTVTGVISEFAFPTHLQFDYLLSMSSINAYQDPQSLNSRTWSGFYTYVVLSPHAQPKQLEDKMGEFMLSFYAPTGESKKQILSGRRLYLQPISDIHLHSKLEKELSGNSDITYVYIFSIAALLILSVAVVNFINLSTAYAFRRTREIGVRKVSGASRTQLIIQFLSESLLTTLLAMILSLVLIKAGIPLYNTLAEKDFSFIGIIQPVNILLLVFLVLLVGVTAGLYPAVMIARLNSLPSLKGKLNSFASGNKVRKMLVIFQFAVAVFMIFSTLIIYRQLQLFHDHALGFDKDQVVAVTIYGEMREQLPAVMDQVKTIPAITHFSVVSNLPGERFGTQPFSPLRTHDKNNDGGVRVMWSDEQLISTLEIPLVTGNNFDRQFPEIKHLQFILNEAAVKAFGYKEPVGQSFILDRDTGMVVGIVKDFNFASLHDVVEPLVIEYNPYQSNYLLLKVKGNKMTSVLDVMKDKLKAIAPSGLFTFHFLDEQLDQLYNSENRMSHLFQVFTIFAIFISCLGLYGLSAYAAQVRTKEIGIRKVLGATVSDLLLMLCRDYLLLVLIGMIVAFPIGYWVMEKWLGDFAYRIFIKGDLFFLTSIFTLLVAFTTVSVQGVKAAMANPSNSLRSE